MKFKLKFIAAMALSVLFMFSGLACKPKTPQNEPEPTLSPDITPTPAGELSLQLPELGEGMVAAAAGSSFGVASDGSVSFIGNNAGHAYIHDWSGVASLITDSKTTAALTSEGRLLICGEREELFKDALKWENIVQIAMNEDSLFGLTSDGRVLMAGAVAVPTRGADSRRDSGGSGGTGGSGGSGRTDATPNPNDSNQNRDSGAKADPTDRQDSPAGGSAELDYENIVSIAAAAKFLIVADASGSVMTSGQAPQIEAWADEKAVRVMAASGRAAALTEDGRLLMTGAENPFTELKALREAFIFENTVAVIDSNGTLHTDSKLCGAEITNAVCMSESGDHALVLLDDGTVKAFGGNEYMQCEVSNWRLRPYVDETGFILGLRVGETLEDGTLVATGSKYTLANGTEGTAVILGDVNSDGIIGEDDINVLDMYVNGQQGELTQARLRAANIIRDSSKPDSVDICDLEQLKYHVAGLCSIDQYARETEYSGKLADCERINRDVLGYIQIAGTNIDYPILYAWEWYYHDHDLFGEKTTRGSLYLYSDKPTRNIVITGHNARTTGTMLHELHLVQDELSAEYGTFANRVWTVNAYGQTHRWEVFAMYEETPGSEEESSQLYNTSFYNKMDEMTEDEIQTWIDYQLERNELDYEVHVTPDDYFMTVVTCGDRHVDSENGARIYFFLRLVG